MAVVPQCPIFPPEGRLSVKDGNVYSSECTSLLKSGISFSGISFSFFKLSHLPDDVLYQFHLDMAESWFLTQCYTTYFLVGTYAVPIWDQCTTISGATGTPVLDFGYAWYSMDCNLPLGSHLSVYWSRPCDRTELVKPCHWPRYQCFWILSWEWNIFAWPAENCVKFCLGPATIVKQ